MNKMNRYSTIVGKDGSANSRLHFSLPTKIVLESSLDLITSHNVLLLEFPTDTYQSLLLVGYSFAKSNNSTVVIVGDNVDFNYLNDLYYELICNDVPLFVGCSFGIKKQDEVIVRPKLPKTTKKSIRVQYKQQIIENIKGPSRPRIILYTDKAVKSISSDEKLYPELKNKSLIIVLGYNYRSLSEFESMCNKCIAEKTKLILVSTFVPDYILEKLKELPDYAVLSLRRTVISQSDLIADKSKEYFQSINYIQNHQIYDQFNVDRTYSYGSLTDLEIIPSESSSKIPTYISLIALRLSQIQKIPFRLEINLKSIAKIVNLALNSFCSIDNIRLYSDLHKCKIDGRQFTNDIESYYPSIDTVSKAICEDIVSFFWQIRNEIEHCKNPFIDNGYSRNNKFSMLFEEIKNIEGKVILLTLNPSEITTLLEYISKSEYSYKVSIGQPKELEDIVDHESTLIISGRPSTSQSYVLSLPFKKIIILSYGGKDFDYTRQYLDNYIKEDHLIKERSLVAVDSLSTKSLTKEQILKLKSVYLSPSSISSDYYNVISDIAKNDEIDELEEPDDLNDFYKIQKEMTLINEYSDESSIEESVTLELINVVDGIKVRKNVDKDSLLAIFDNNTHSIIEMPISLELVGSIMIARADESSGHSSLTDILIELYDLDQMADTTVVELWDDSMKLLKGSGIDDIYEEYLEKGGDKQKNTVMTWLNRRTMGPESVQDIRIMGHIAGIEEIENNSNYIDKQFNIIRIQKRLIGRRLFDIIAQIIQRNDSDLDPRAIQLKDILSHRLYIIENVCKADRPSTESYR